MNVATLTGRRIALAVAAVLAASPQLALAQKLAIEEIVVTAQKRSESLEDVPVAVTALSDEMLRDARIIDTSGLVKLAPSLTFQRRAVAS